MSPNPHINVSGWCYVAPEIPKTPAACHETPFTLSNENIILYRGEDFAWVENKKNGLKVGYGEQAAFYMNILNEAYKLGYEKDRFV